MGSFFKVLAVAVLLFAATLQADGFTLKSAVSGQLGMAQVANAFGCQGGNLSAALSWENAPKGTQSFAVTVYDPDAPTGSGWWHWVVFDIPANITSLPENAGDPAKNLMPKGAVQSTTSTGKPGFLGACPPQGNRPHAYIFTVYALDTAKLGIDASATAELAGFMLGGHTLAKASIIAYYNR